jgi:hypothetical protein
MGDLSCDQVLSATLSFMGCSVLPTRTFLSSVRRTHAVSIRVAVADSPGPLRPPAQSCRGCSQSWHPPEATATAAAASRPYFGAARPCKQGASNQCPAPRRLGASSHAAPAGREQAPDCFVAGVPTKPLSERPAGREEAAAGREESAARREQAVVGPYPALRPPPLLRAPRLPWVRATASRAVVASSGCAARLPPAAPCPTLRPPPVDLRPAISLPPAGPRPCSRSRSPANVRPAARVLQLIFSTFACCTISDLDNNSTSSRAPSNSPRPAARQLYLFSTPGGQAAVPAPLLQVRSRTSTLCKCWLLK